MAAPPPPRRSSTATQLGRRASSATASDRRTSTACSASSVKQLTPCSSSAVTTASAWTISGETASASTRDNERDDERDEGLGFQPGDRLVHVKHGLGVAVGYLPDGRLEIAFDDGQRHKYRRPSVARKIARAPADAPPPPISVPARSRGKLSAFFVKGLVEESLVELSAATAAALRSLDPAAAVPAAPPREETLERALLAIFGSFDVRRASCRAEEDTERLLHVISTGFESLQDFNQHVRVLMLGPAAARASRRSLTLSSAAADVSHISPQSAMWRSTLISQADAPAEATEGSLSRGKGPTRLRQRVTQLSDLFSARRRSAEASAASVLRILGPRRRSSTPSESVARSRGSCESMTEQSSAV